MTNDTDTSLTSPVIVLDPHTPSLNEEAFVHQFGRKVVGQPAAEEIARMAHNAFSNPFRDKTRPIGIYFLVGPSRTGKSLTGEVLAELFHNDPKALTRLQCADYEADHQVADLKGSPNGYVGYKDPDKYKVAPDEEDSTSIISQHNLKRVRLQSDKDVDIIILEEFEKSGYDFYKLWMGVFDKGTLRLGNGKLVDFSNAIFVITSNLGMDKVEKLASGGIGFTNGAREVTAADVATVVEEEMKHRFKPEFRNRLDAVVIFQPFTNADLFKVVDSEMNLLQERINKQAPAGKKFAIRLDRQAATKLLSATGKNVAQLKRVLNAQVITPIGRLFNAGKLPPGCTLHITFSEKIDNYEFSMEAPPPDFKAEGSGDATGNQDQAKGDTANGDKSGKPGEKSATLHLPAKTQPPALPAPRNGNGNGNGKDSKAVPPNVLQKFAVQVHAKSFYDAETRAEELVHYLTDVLTVDLLYEVLTHKEPYSFSAVCMISQEQLDLLKLKLPYVVFRKLNS